MAHSKSSSARQPLPVWGVVAAIAVCAVAVGIFGWRMLSSSSEEAGPSKKVAPGSYDLRAEAAKAQSRKSAGASQNDSP